ncbi:MAG TPA: 50S ribosomal protein L27 [bacterium]|jgi:large subunit ribosomal protein L27|nr:50S ribosomal protein L27 [bacterium]
MAHKKAGGSTRLGRDSAGKRLGVKVNHGEAIKIGQIIIRQRGTKYAPGANVKVGRDDTLYSVANGKVAYSHKKLTKFDGRLKLKTIVGVK